MSMVESCDQETLDIMLDLGDDEESIAPDSPSLETLAHLVQLAPSQSGQLDDEAASSNQVGEDLLMPTPEPAEKKSSSSSAPPFKSSNSSAATDLKTLITPCPEADLPSGLPVRKAAATVLHSPHHRDMDRGLAALYESQVQKPLQGKQPPKEGTALVSTVPTSASNVDSAPEKEQTMVSKRKPHIEDSAPEKVQTVASKRTARAEDSAPAKACPEKAQTVPSKRKFGEMMRRSSLAQKRGNDADVQKCSAARASKDTALFCETGGNDLAVVTEVFSSLIRDALHWLPTSWNEKFPKKNKESLEELLKKHRGSEAQLYYQILAKHVACGGLPKGMAPIDEQVETYTELLRRFYGSFAPSRVRYVAKEIRLWGELDTPSLLFAYLDRVWDVMTERRTGTRAEPIHPEQSSLPVPPLDAIVEGTRQRLTRKSPAQELSPQKAKKTVLSEAGACEPGLLPLPQNAQFLEKLCGQIPAVRHPLDTSDVASCSGADEDLIEWLMQFKV